MSMYLAVLTNSTGIGF